MRSDHRKMIWLSWATFRSMKEDLTILCLSSEWLDNGIAKPIPSHLHRLILSNQEEQGQALPMPSPSHILTL